jgi:hypothetical protein
MSRHVQRLGRFEPKARLYHQEIPAPKWQTLEERIRAGGDEAYRRNEAERYRSYLSSFSPEEIEAMLRRVDPEGKMPYGTRFVTRMLESPGGKRELERFANRALAIMDVENGLDIRQDFTDDQRDMLFNDKKNWQPAGEGTPPDELATEPDHRKGGITRRGMMGLGAGAALGLGTEGAIQALGGGGDPEPQSSVPDNPVLKQIHELEERMRRVETHLEGGSLGERLQGGVLMGVGVHYAYDVYVEGQRIKDEEVVRRVKEVEDVVYDLAQLSREERPRSAAERYRNVTPPARF